ncbi:MAG: carboxypeptidase-like regulatory domain-containing protein [Tannerellaceae bacterium]|nr:carboxypeptidase-like regulatory domain-containing protein [Tannerellaceae bacterium]
MRTLGKHAMEILLSILIFAPVNTAWAKEDPGYTIITGLVRDKVNKKRLEYVNISVPGSNIGTVTNADGEFSFKISDSIPAIDIELSHIGYYNNKVSLSGDDMKDLTIWLTPNSNVLDGIIIRAGDPRLIVEEALKKVPDNYSTSNNMLTGFYRETAQKGRRYINISEAIIDVYKTSYEESADRDRVQILKGRKLLSQKSGDTLVVKLLGGPNLSVYVDIVKNPDILLDPDLLSFYKFRMEESTIIDDRPQYVIRFIPQAILSFALYEGKLYIDKERLAFTRTEFNLNMDDKNKATQAILKKKPFGLRFKPTEVSFLVTYKECDGLTHLNYIRNIVQFKCDWKRRLFSTNYTIQSEMVVTDSKEDNINTIPYKAAFKTNQSLSDQVTNFYDEDFWGAYNIIEPTESLESAVSKLKKQQR